MTTTHPTWIEIDRQAITDNCAQILRDTGTGLMAIVKADAYGHGAVEVSRAALKGGASWLGVARFGEGLYSHLAAADEQSPMNEIQCRRFDLAVHAMEECGLRPRRVHLANSAGAFFLPRSRYNLARIGNVVLGLQAPRRRQPKRWLPAASIQRTGIRDSFA